ncbi:MAG TPA: hypothetical protein VGZ00_07915 [Candidatus Baltobacteraceae bacterium]|nr:hypothetical protein [Candidatus Baltobacteraceae bacterium]
MPDISGICAKAREESDTARAFTMLDEMCMEALQDDTHVKAISAEDARDIVETFEALGVKLANVGRNADAALCYAVTARNATFFPDLRTKVVPALHQAFELTDFIDIKQDGRLAVEVSFIYEFFDTSLTPFESRNEPELIKFFETGLAASIIRTERSGNPLTLPDVSPLIEACMNAGLMHAEVGRFKNASYWLEQGAVLAQKISYYELGFLLWYRAGVCSDESKANNLAEQERCFLNAFGLLPNTPKPDRNTDDKTFNERHEALRVMGFFFFAERRVSVSPSLWEKGAECFLQAIDDLKEARREKEHYPSSAVMRSRLGKYYREVAQLDRAQMHLRDAVTTWRNAISQTWKNETSQPPAYIREGLADTLNQLGLTLEEVAAKAQTGKREKTLLDAQGSFKEGREVYRDLFAITIPSDMKARATYHLRAQKLARSEGRVAGNRGKWADAVKTLEGAVQFEGKYRKLLRCDVYDEITQDLVHARSRLRIEHSQSAQPINNGHSKNNKTRKLKPN